MSNTIVLTIDAGWIGAIASIIAVALTLVIYFITQKKKVLSYEVLSEYPLISIDNEIKGRLQILLEGKAVEDVHLLLIKFINHGNLPIATSDYEQPLTLTFTDSSQILSSEYVNASPANLAPRQTIQDQVITFEPLLLNGGDYFTTKILVGKYSGRFGVDARILGVKSIARASSKSRRAKLYNAALRGLVVVFILLTASLIANTVYRTSQDPVPVIEPPTIRSLSISRHIVPEQETASLTAYVLDGCGCREVNPDMPCTSVNKCDWMAKRGMILPAENESKAEYHSPLDPGLDVISLRVTNRSGQTATASIEVQVVDPKAPQSSPQPTK